ncbi:MAG: hypothetical protein QXX95_05340 [Nitrososphaerales archaeon]
MVQVLKIGGSLLNYPKELKALVNRLCNLSKEYELIAVTGGASFADLVRYYYWELKLNEKICHKMALLSMDLYTLLIESLSEGKALYSYSLKEALKVAKNGKLSLLMASRLITKKLPSNWDFTSDSIAIYLAKRLKAERLIVIKDVDGIFDSDPKKNREAKLIKRISLEELKSIKESCLDKYFPIFMRKANFDCYIVNGLHLDRVESAIKGKEFFGTRIVKERV